MYNIVQRKSCVLCTRKHTAMVIFLFLFFLFYEYPFREKCAITSCEVCVQKLQSERLKYRFSASANISAFSIFYLCSLDRCRYNVSFLSSKKQIIYRAIQYAKCHRHLLLVNRIFYFEPIPEPVNDVNRIFV